MIILCVLVGFEQPALHTKTSFVPKRITLYELRIIKETVFEDSSTLNFFKICFKDIVDICNKNLDKFK